MSHIQLFTPEHWKEYSLIDCGGFEKLEKFGDFVTIRPEPQAIWDKALDEATWRKMAHVKFIGTSSNSGRWEQIKPMPENWKLTYKSPMFSLKFNLALTGFKHVGVFPEQAVNWDYIYESVKKIKAPTPRFLNLFAYTGGASLAAKAAGADVVHVDAIKQVVSWSRRNMELSNLQNIRWVVEDAVKFVKRELKRGNSYHGIILDPPAFGHGPNGESWKLEKNMNALMSDVFKLLDAEQYFLILNTYSLGFSPLIIDSIYTSAISRFAAAPHKKEVGELYLPTQHGAKLPLGVLGRLEHF